MESSPVRITEEGMTKFRQWDFFGIGNEGNIIQFAKYNWYESHLEYSVKASLRLQYKYTEEDPREVGKFLAREWGGVTVLITAKDFGGKSHEAFAIIGPVVFQAVVPEE